MIDIRPALDATRLNPLRNVARQAAARAPRPAWIIVENEADDWLHELTTVTYRERSRGVVVVRSEQALLQSVRLAVGGALWEPPSTAAMVMAFQSAQGREELPAICDLCVTTALAAHEPPRFVMRWRNQGLWRHQLGEPFLAALLWKVAKVAGALPAVLPGPCLLLAEARAPAIDRALSELEGQGALMPADGLEIIALPSARTPEETVAAALRLVCTAPENGAEMGAGAPSGRSQVDPSSPVEARSMAPRPVYELPSGRLMGWWSSREVGARPEEGWIAVPEIHTDEGIRWRLVDNDGGITLVDEVFGTREIGALGRRVIRMPGWASARIRPGSPAGLLAEHLVAAARRVGTTVWIPNADSDAVKMALRLGTPVWVDGPAVPRRELSSAP